MQTLFPPEVTPTSRHTLRQHSESAQPWYVIKQRLQESLPTESYNAWIAPLEGEAVSANEVVVILPNLVFYQGIHNEYLDHIERAKINLGFDHILIRFEVEGSDLQSEQLLPPEIVPPPAFDVPSPFAHAEFSATTGHNQTNDSHAELNHEPENPVAAAEIPRTESTQAFSRSLSNEGHLNRNYTFDTFVKGDSNQFAVATCQSSAENPGKAYNPLFIYGSTGLGKTHLLHAVGNSVLAVNPNAVVTYITSERFMNEMIYCLRFQKMYEFRQKYRNCDVLLVDDIQFISGKKATQEEFFHTFNTLYAAKKQIVITSDLIPKDIPDIEDRLRNRFQWGLIADIQPPSVEHRIAILMNKAESFGYHIGYDVAGYIAKHHKRNVRELEGALQRLDAYSKLHGEPISLDLALRTFKDMVVEAPKRLTVETVQKIVADYFKVRVADLKSKRRQQAIAYPRQIAMYLARKLINSSYPDIGEKFGGKDHTTVMHNVKTIQTRMDKDLDLRAHLESLERQLEQLQ